LQNLNNAVGYFRSALEFYTAADAPVRIAITQTNLGDAYLALSKISQSIDLFMKSLEAYRDAGKLFREQHHITDYANNQAKLGAAYMELAAQNPGGTDILQAIDCLEAGLEVLDRQSNPEEYERIQAQMDEARRRLDAVGEGKG
ncbi:MAG TPA: hypothetical protein VHY08_12435, partial [Bacillota bacterium]|nr:hypothetical protein [Bacillota bacterium]